MLVASPGVGTGSATAEEIQTTGVKTLRRPLTRGQDLIAGYSRDPLLRQSFFMMASGATFAGGGFIFWLAAARLASSHQVGLAAGLASAVALLNFLTSFGLTYGVLRFFAATGRDSGPALNAALLLSAVTSAAGAAVFIAGAHIWSPDLDGLLEAWSNIAFFVAANVAVSVGLLLDAAFAAGRSAQWAFVRALAITVGRLAPLVVLGTRGATALFVAAFLAIIATSLVMVALLPRLVPLYSFRLRPMGTAGRDLIKFSIGTFPASLLAGAPAFLLPLVVLALLGPSSTAWFYVAWSFGLILQLLPSTISQVSLSEGVKEGAWQIAARARRLALAVLLPLVAVVILGASPILSLYGQEYAEHSTAALRWLTIGAIPWAIISINTSSLRVEGRSAAVVALSGAFAVLSISFAIAGEELFGLAGLAGGFAAGTALAAAASEVVRLRSAPSALHLRASA